LLSSSRTVQPLMTWIGTPYDMAGPAHLHSLRCWSLGSTMMRYLYDHDDKIKCFVVSDWGCVACVAAWLMNYANGSEYWRKLNQKKPPRRFLLAQRFWNRILIRVVAHLSRVGNTRVSQEPLESNKTKPKFSCYFEYRLLPPPPPSASSLRLLLPRRVAAAAAPFEITQQLRR
jgi:hypothetical protein